ncbi:hypothetical protein BAUCODRAFT_31542 [Baudoinia panamericana UAMH 10762]|uniref:Uncharacterized protein n=1 Tax=Baudoinia panamericana (strain UAMH 10762) TaxID=717646 RepID=M2MQV3_BAUPA|nr:uncharacterized protein BAUCODRAFT_31542 [Baudoinia panamericana UAMH 10762]EMC99206.1 hypothetical protein BAUCODRAFT_31542 [Baudoinia panamericana UAMH 10762]
MTCSYQFNAQDGWSCQRADRGTTSYFAALSDHSLRCSKLGADIFHSDPIQIVRSGSHP